MVPIPKDPQGREKRRKAFVESRINRYRTADRYRDKLIEFYGKEKSAKIKYVEAFEVCEYGRRPSKEVIRRLFPFYD